MISQNHRLSALQLKLYDRMVWGQTMDDFVMDYRKQYDVVSLKMECKELKSLPIFVIYPRVELEN